MDTFFATLATNIVFWIGAVAGSLTTAAIAGHGAKMFLKFAERRRIRNFNHLVREVSHSLGRIETKVTPDGGSKPESLGTRVATMDSQLAELLALVLEDKSKTGTRISTVEDELADIKHILIEVLTQAGYYQKNKP